MAACADMQHRNGMATRGARVRRPGRAAVECDGQVALPSSLAGKDGNAACMYLAGLPA